MARMVDLPLDPDEYDTGIESEEDEMEKKNKPQGSKEIWEAFKGRKIDNYHSALRNYCQYNVTFPAGELSELVAEIAYALVSRRQNESCQSSDFNILQRMLKLTLKTFDAVNLCAVFSKLQFTGGISEIFRNACLYSLQNVLDFILDNEDIRGKVQEMLMEGVEINIMSLKFSCVILKKLLQIDAHKDLSIGDIVDVMIGLEDPLAEERIIQLLDSNMKLANDTYRRIFVSAFSRKWQHCMRYRRLIKQQKWEDLRIILQKCFRSEKRLELGVLLLSSVNGMQLRILGQPCEKEASMILEYAGYKGLRHTPFHEKSIQVLDTDRRVQYIEYCILSTNFNSPESLEKLFQSETTNVCESCTANFHISPSVFRGLQHIFQMQYVKDKETEGKELFSQTVQENNIILANLFWRRRLVKHRIFDQEVLYEPFTLSPGLVRNFNSISPSMQRCLRLFYVADFIHVWGNDFHYLDLTWTNTRKHDENNVQSRQAYLVAVPSKPLSISGPVNFGGIPVLWRRLEDMDTRLRQEESPLDSVPGSRAQELFMQHTNLNIVAATMDREIGNKIMNITFPERCITLYCWAKGYIPIGEREFPTRINTFPVDVREGYFQLGAGKKVKPGRGIQRKGLIGTLGGFVERDNKQYALTCAHVLLKEEELIYASVDHLANASVFMTGNDNVITEVGKLEAFSFEFADQNKVSIDAALIRLNTNATLDHHFPKTMDGTQDLLSKVGFKSPPVYDNGKISSVDGVRRDLLLKHGNTTGFTFGHLLHNGFHAKVIQEKLKLPPSIQMNANAMEVECNIRVFNQVEVRGYHCRQFFDIGDSGSLVFRVMSDDSLQCIGLAIGLTSYNTCVVTPIQEVLKSLDRKIPSVSETPGELRMKSFKKAEQHSNIDPNLNAVLSVLTGEMSKLRCDIRTDVSNIEKRIDGRLGSIESDIKRIKDVVGLSPSRQQNEDSSDDDL